MRPEIPDHPGPDTSSLLISDLEEALLAVDRVRAGRIIEATCAASSPVSCIETLIVPVLEEIGEKWEQGQVALSQVYMSGRISEEIVATMLPPGSPERITQPKIAIAVLEDHHTLGKRILLAVLRAGGYEVTDYGAGVTVDGLVERVIQDRAPFRFDADLWKETGADAVGRSASDTLALVRGMAGAVVS